MPSRTCAQAHTPGPLDWTARGVDEQAHIYLVDSTERKIASLWGRPDEKIANARLFAAAPELLEALEELLAPLDPDKIGDGPTYIAMLADRRAKACAAIAKATGQASAASSPKPQGAG